MSDIIFPAGLVLVVVTGVFLLFRSSVVTSQRLSTSPEPSSKETYCLLFPTLPALLPLLMMLLVATSSVVSARLLSATLQRRQRFYAEAVSVPATVAGKPFFHGKGAHYSITYIFHDPFDNTRKFQGRDFVSRKVYDRTMIGDQVEVLYFPRPPYLFLLKDGDSPFNAWIVCEAVLVFSLEVLVTTCGQMWRVFRFRTASRLATTLVLNKFKGLTSRGHDCYYLLFDQLEPMHDPFWLSVSRSNYTRLEIHDRVTFRYVPGAPHIFRPMWRIPAVSAIQTESDGPYENR